MEREQAIQVLKNHKYTISNYSINTPKSEFEEALEIAIQEMENNNLYGNKVSYGNTPLRSTNY